MAGPDLSVFDRIKTKADFDRESEIFDLKRQAMQQVRGGNLPAALQIADRLTQLRASGDPASQQQIQDVLMAQKMLRVDPGVTMQGGMSYELPGYSDVVSGIEGAKAGAKQQAEKNVDLRMNPRIVGGEADARNQSDLHYAAPKRTAEERAEAEAAQYGNQLKNANTAMKSLDILRQAEALLPNASGSIGGTALSAAKAAIGHSDQTTQANEELKLLSGWLVANVPRMEGPQSNFDVQNYQRMAADLGNTMKPIGDRLAALQGLRSLQEKYAGNQSIPQEAPFQGQQFDSQFGFPDVANGQQYATPEVVDPRNIPMDAVRELRTDPSPQARAEFDEIFGPGAADMVIRNGK